MKPEWDPPCELVDPFVCRIKSDRAAWTRAIRGRIPDRGDVATAHTLASYSNVDGSNAHPGVARLVADLLSSDKTIRRSLANLIEGGWVSVSHRARRKLKEADVHQLSIPAPVAVEMDLWNEGWAQWIERPAGEPTRPGAAVTRDRKKRPFPAVTGDRNKSVLAVADEFLPVTSSVLPVTGDLPPGSRVTYHQVLTTRSYLTNRMFDIRLSLTAEAA